jgi:hypothetical protein
VAFKRQLPKQKDPALPGLNKTGGDSNEQNSLLPKYWTVSAENICA